MLRIHMTPQFIGCGLLENGNVGVFGEDKSTGLAVMIEFGSSEWARFLEQAPRLKGVGIAVPAGARNLHPIKDGDGPA